MHEKTTRWVLGRHKCDKIFATYLNLISCTFIMWFQPSSWKIIHTHLHHIVWRIDYAKAKHHISSCCLFFYLLALSAKWRMSIWKLVNFHSSLDFVESFVFFCNVTKMINRYHVNNELSAISMCQGTLDIKCITYKYQSCLTHAISSFVQNQSVASNNQSQDPDLSQWFQGPPQWLHLHLWLIVT